MRKKNLIVIGLVMGLIPGCNNHEEITEKKPSVVSEVHDIYEIDGNYIRGERIVGTGEGVYYSKEELKKAGLKHMKVGDRIKLSWIKDDYEDENWDNLYSATNLKKVD